MVTSQRDPVVDQKFPEAFADGYALTSGRDSDYNCIAWATYVDDVNWWPLPHNQTGWYWPATAPREATVNAFLIAYGTKNWTDCGTDGAMEEGFEKLAIYVDASGTVTHAARQLADGCWTSKLGPYKDISHSTPAGLEGSLAAPTEYGRVGKYMKRSLIASP